MTGYYKNDEKIDYANAGSAIASGDVVQIGDILGIAIGAIAASTGVGPVLIRGIVQVTKVGSQAWVQGATVYYDSGNTRFTTVAAGNTRAGVAALAAGSGAGVTTGYIVLNASPGADIGTQAAHIADPASAAAMTQDTLTDSSGGTAATTLAAISGTFDQSEVANAIASLAAQLAKVKTDVAAVRTGSEANNTSIDAILVALEGFKAVASA